MIFRDKKIFSDFLNKKRKSARDKSLQKGERERERGIWAYEREERSFTKIGRERESFCNERMQRGRQKKM